MNIEEIKAEQISKIKQRYPTTQGQEDWEFIQPFEDEWPEFIVTADDDWVRYEFVDGEFVRGSDPFAPNGMKRYMEEARPNGVLALKLAIENDYWGFVLKYGIHPADVDTPMNEYGEYNVSDSESSSVRHVTQLSQGRGISEFRLDEKEEK